MGLMDILNQYDSLSYKEGLNFFKKNPNKCFEIDNQINLFLCSKKLFREEEKYWMMVFLIDSLNSYSNLLDSYFDNILRKCYKSEKYKKDFSQFFEISSRFEEAYNSINKLNYWAIAGFDKQDLNQSFLKYNQLKTDLYWISEFGKNYKKAQDLNEEINIWVGAQCFEKIPSLKNQLLSMAINPTS
jgi:hypothetical protein